MATASLSGHQISWRAADLWASHGIPQRRPSGLGWWEFNNGHPAAQSNLKDYLAALAGLAHGGSVNMLGAAGMQARL